jgi:tetratricopeptide (TPR) repeat protein
MDLILNYFNACIKNYELNTAEELFHKNFRHLDEYDYAQEKLAAMVCALILTYDEIDDFDNALRIYRDAVLNDSMSITQAGKIIVSSMMVHILAIKGEIDDAEKIFYSQNYKANSLLNLKHRSRAAMGLVAGYIKEGDIEKAYKLHTDGHFKEIFSEDLGFKLNLLKQLTLSYILRGDFQIARNLMECLAEICKSKKTAKLHVQTLLDLHSACQSQHNEEGVELIQQAFSYLSPRELRILSEHCEKHGISLELI